MPLASKQAQQICKGRLLMLSKEASCIWPHGLASLLHARLCGFSCCGHLPEMLCIPGLHWKHGTVCKMWVHRCHASALNTVLNTTSASVMECQGSAKKHSLLRLVWFQLCSYFRNFFRCGMMHETGLGLWAFIHDSQQTLAEVASVWGSPSCCELQASACACQAGKFACLSWVLQPNIGGCIHDPAGLLTTRAAYWCQKNGYMHRVTFLQGVRGASRWA